MYLYAWSIFDTYAQESDHHLANTQRFMAAGDPHAEVGYMSVLVGAGIFFTSPVRSFLADYALVENTHRGCVGQCTHCFTGTRGIGGGLAVVQLVNWNVI